MKAKRKAAKRARRRPTGPDTDGERIPPAAYEEAAKTLEGIANAEIAKTHPEVAKEWQVRVDPSVLCPRCGQVYGWHEDAAACPYCGAPAVRP